MNDLLIDVDPPFDRSIHLQSQSISTSQMLLVKELKDLLANSNKLDENWCTDHLLNLFLIARCNRVSDAFKMMIIAKEWRDHRQPHDVKDWETSMQKESETGKIYCPCKVTFLSISQLIFILQNRFRSLGSTVIDF